MPYHLTFEPDYTSCTLRFGEAAEHAPSYERPYRWLSWSCVLNLDGHVRLSTGGELKRAGVGKDEHGAGSVTVGTEAIEANGRETTGYIRYHAAVEGEDFFPGMDEGYGISLRVSPDAFERLLALAGQRQLPSISVVIPNESHGIKMGWEPDGSGKEWDTKEHPVLEVVAAQFSYPLIAEDPLLAPPKPDPAAAMTQVLVYIAQKQKWVLAALVALCALTLWRR